MLSTTRSILALVTSWYALVFAAFCTLVVLGNNLGQGIPGIFFYAVTYFFVGLALGWFARSLGLTVVIFLLPLTPTLNQQLAAIVPLLEVKRTLSGYDLVAGFIAGHVLRYPIFPKAERVFFALPPPISFACLVLTVSVFVAIARNLWQAASIFTFPGLKYNAMNMLSIGWRDDYYPLVDFFTYGLAVAFVACVIQVLSAKEKPAETILNPLLWGVIVSALWSVLQSKTGLGLPYSSASGNRYYQGFGFAGTGFQPDIHAFSGHMLLGAVGAWGCFFLRDAKISRWLISAAIFMGWVGLAVSKSRGSALLACTFYALIGAWWLWRRNKAYLFMVTTAIFFGMGAVYLFHRWGMSIIPLWLIQYVEGLPRLHINNLEALNAHFGNRAEIYRAAFRMFEQFPLMGLGQGTFYRMSGILEFSGSKFLASINGENAHNYFLQIMAETGLIGFFTLAAVIIVPIVRTRFSPRLLPVVTILIAFGLGNIFAHSLLIRENFFLFAACVALLYVQAQQTLKIEAQDNKNYWFENLLSLRRKRQRLKLLTFLLGSIMAALIFREVYTSFGRFPYLYGARCYAPMNFKIGDWTSGMFILDIPADANGVELTIRETQPPYAREPLILSVNVQQPNVALTQKTFRYELDINTPQNIFVPIDSFGQKMPQQLVFTTSRCFTPKNLGVNADPRRLGIVVENISWRTN